MQKTYAILRTLNELLENKEMYSAEDYKKSLLELLKEIEHQLLAVKYNEVSKEEQQLILEQYQALLKMS